MAGINDSVTLGELTGDQDFLIEGMTGQGKSRTVQRKAAQVLNENFQVWEVGTK